MGNEVPERNLALDLVRVTEAAALSAARHMGLGDDMAADRAAAHAMRHMLQTLDATGRIAIRCGSYPKAELEVGDSVGGGGTLALDVAIIPVDGARLLAQGRANAVSIVAVAERGAMIDLEPVRYVEKLAVGRPAAAAIDLAAPIERNLWSIARALGKDVRDLTVVILDRPRHAQLIAQVRAAGARIRLISDGDVAGALMAAMPETGIDVLVGTGGSGEAVLAACALKCVGGGMQCRLAPMSAQEDEAVRARGLDPAKILTLDQLVRGENVFVAVTGITDGELLRGVQYYGGGARTHSLSMRCRSGTIRWIEAQHHWEKLMRISQLPYDD